MSGPSDPYETRADPTVPGPGRPAATPPAPSDPYRTRADVAGESEGLPPRPPLPKRYDLKKLLGSGGMGDVWLGRDRRLRRPVAVKVVQERWAGHDGILRRFVEEAQLTSQLAHPAIPPVYETGELPDGRPYFCMKVVRGRTLASILARRADPADDLPRLLAVFLQVCQAVAYAHSKGVIHRDLKPHNVMVGSFGEVQVMDWGLAKVLRDVPSAAAETAEASAATSAVETDRAEQAADQTQAGSVLGTFTYMPPEQARGEVGHLDRRCDVFGLGAILCEILTGKPPYQGSREEVRLHAQLGFTERALERLAACPADAELTALVRACISAKAADRPADAAAVAAAVSSHLAAVQQRLRQAELAEAEARARQEEAKRTAEAEARAAVARRTRNLSVALAVVLLLGIGAALTFGIEAVRQRGEAELARQVAEAEKTKANLAQRSEKDQREIAEGATRKAEQLVYARELALAQREWEANNAGAAWNYLRGTRADFRRWEYRHLVTLFNSNQRTFRGDARPIYSVAFSPDSRRLAIAGLDGMVRVWGADQGQQILTLKGHTDHVTSVAFSPDGLRLATAGRDRTVKVWDASKGRSQEGE